jgi:penicillin-binding protein 1C
VLKRLLVAAGLCAGVTAVLLVAAFFVISRDLPTNEQIVNRQIDQSTKIYDRTGETLLWEIGGNQKRTILPFDEIPRSIKDATIAIEDERFYQEAALDWRGIVRALVANLRHRGVVQGGSTITQQLARNAFLAPDRTFVGKFVRKFKEFVLAVRLNRFYSKDEILGLYLNEIPYGSTLYGIEAASQGYFAKTAKELTLGESATLAALVKAPTYYSPWGNHRKELLARQQLVLKKMRELRMISEEEERRARETPLKFEAQSKGIQAPHFAIAVQDYLVKKYGEDMVRKGGLRIVTTLDWELQQLAEKAVAEGAARNEKLYGGKNAALVAQDPKTGQVLAMVGSRDYFDIENEGNFNVATDGFRQPGSALKPFVYLAAFEKGYAPQTLLFDVPTEFTSGDPRCPAIPDLDKELPSCFHPENFDQQFRGPVTLRTALAQSINVPAVKTLYLVGLRRAIETANKFGLVTLNDPDRYGLSLVLGGGEVRLIDLVGAYATLSQEGVRHNQALVLEVKDAEGKTLERFEDAPSQVVDASYPRLINDILADRQERAGLFQGSLSLTTLPDYQVALKTGTSNDYRDAWVVGYTPFLATGIWAGNNDNTPMHRQGGSILAAVPIWHAFMSEAVKKYQPEFFAQPDAPVPDKPLISGLLPADGQLHSMLYYVDKNDPLGPQPEDPSRDPQFTNWETGVAEWVRGQGGGALNVPASPAGAVSSLVRLSIQEPLDGASVSGTLRVRAQAESNSPLTVLRVYVNGALQKELKEGLGTRYALDAVLALERNEAQSLIEVEVVNASGGQRREGVIVYGI